MKKIINWAKRFWHIRKLNLIFHNQEITEFAITEPPDTDYLAIIFFCKNYYSLIVVLSKKGKEVDIKKICATIKSVLEAWPEYRIHGFHLIDFIFRNKLSFLEKRKSRRILKFEDVIFLPKYVLFV